MRDFPMFSTENGVGSLVLKEIPYNATAYITIQSSACPLDFLQECLDFCRIAGAETVYASGHKCLEKYPHFTTVVQMSAAMECFADTDVCLFPVTENTMTMWREIYNERMKGVHNAAYMSENAMLDLMKLGGAYFVHKDNELLGIGVARDDRIACIASVRKGSGREIVLALTHALFCERVILEVASTNLPAIRLYESMGFIKTAEISKWYKII